MSVKKIDYMLIIKAFLIFAVTSIASIVIFAAVIYFLEGGYEYSPLFATVSLGVGCFFAAWFLGRKTARKGIAIGFLTGAAGFVLATLVSLLVNSGALTVHTLLRFVIFILFGMVGGIIGVNQNSTIKYV